MIFTVMMHLFSTQAKEMTPCTFSLVGEQTVQEIIGRLYEATVQEGVRQYTQELEFQAAEFRAGTVGWEKT